jgi:hypothetical protein
MDHDTKHLAYYAAFFIVPDVPHHGSFINPLKTKRNLRYIKNVRNAQ